MPGDTLIVTSMGDTILVSDSTVHVQVAKVQTDATGIDGPTFFIVIAVFCLIIAIPFIINWFREKFIQKEAYEIAEASLRVNYKQYDDLLIEHNGYYKSLPVAMKARFLERVATFAATKTITCVNFPQDDRMSLLIAAASVQITFGLDKYLLDFFDTIYVMQHDYHYGIFEKPFEGHVSSNGIYLSWDNFLRGYENYSDGDNVGIHEMAHALAYVNFMADANEGKDEAFIQRFYNFSTVGRPIFNDMQNGKTTMLGDYASSNYNEFWAVSVETFFEKAQQMKTEMPDLYTALCSLLNQDPLLPGKLLSVE